MANSRNPTPLATAQRWSALAPTTPMLPPADYEKFFATAGKGTLVKVWGDLFSRTGNGDWINLNLIIQRYGEDDYSYYESRSPEAMAKWALQDFRGATVLLLN